MIKWSDNWVYGDGSSWEVIIILLADPSGTYNYVPSEVNELFNSESCPSCQSSLNKELEAKLGDKSVTANTVGLKTTTQTAFKSDMKTTPTFNRGDPVVVKNTVTTNFSNANQGDLVFVTVVRGDTSANKLTVE